MWEQATTLQISGRRVTIEGLGGGPPVAASGLLHLDLPVEGACFEQQQQQTVINLSSYPPFPSSPSPPLPFSSRFNFENTCVFL